MTQQKHILKVLSILCLIFFVVTYIISVNIEIGLISLNATWISNSFVFACSSGIFASFLVVIVTELFKLIQVQRTAELYLYNQLTIIYGQLHIAENNINDALSSNNIISTNMLNTLIQTIGQVTNSIRYIDYNPLSISKKTNEIKGLLNDITTQLIDLGTLQSDCIYLSMAINSDGIVELSKGNNSPKVTSKSPSTSKTLKCLLKEVLYEKHVFKKDIDNLDKTCRGRVNWAEMKKKISSITYPDTSLEKFWSKFDQC